MSNMQRLCLLLVKQESVDQQKRSETSGIWRSLETHNGQRKLPIGLSQKKTLHL